MSFGALQIAGLGWSTPIQSCPVAPLRIEFDTIGRIGHHDNRPAALQQSLHRFRASRIATEQTMFTEQP